MKIEKLKWISREIVRANPDKVFLFGDNLRRYGLGGQAKEMRGEPNAVGIVTKCQPDVSNRAYLHDDEFAENCLTIDLDLDAAMDLAAMLADYYRNIDSIIVIPAVGIGTGLAELDKRAPRTFQYLQKRLAELEDS